MISHYYRKYKGNKGKWVTCCCTKVGAVYSSFMSPFTNLEDPFSSDILICAVCRCVSCYQSHQTEQKSNSSYFHRHSDLWCSALLAVLKKSKRQHVIVSWSHYYQLTDNKQTGNVMVYKIPERFYPHAIFESRLKRDCLEKCMETNIAR